MATNLALDDKLIRQAVKFGKHKTKREAVTAALESYIRSKRLDDLFDLIGKVDYYDDAPAMKYKRPKKRRSA